MSSRILVTYASRTGTTAGVAEASGKTLAESGMQVEVLPMKEVRDLSPCGAVVAGSAIQGSNWLPEALDFVRAHQAELARKPFAAFLVCMTLAMAKGDYREHVKGFMQPVRALVQPVSEGYFAKWVNSCFWYKYGILFIRCLHLNSTPRRVLRT